MSGKFAFIVAALVFMHHWINHCIASSGAARDTEASTDSLASRDSMASCGFILPNTSRHIFLAIKDRDDGIGSLLARTVPAAAFAWKHGWNFAGIMDRERKLVGHHITAREFIKFYFGGNPAMFYSHHYFAKLNISLTNDSMTTTLPFSGGDLEQLEQLALRHINRSTGEPLCPGQLGDGPSTSASAGLQRNCYLILYFNNKFFFDNITESLLQHFTASNSNAVRPHPLFTDRTLSLFAEETFLHKLRNGARCGIRESLSQFGNVFERSQIAPRKNNSVALKRNINYVNVSQYHLRRKQPPDIRVAVHLRIGDVSPESRFAWKWTPLSFYYHILLHLEQLLPGPQIDIHVFTSVPTFSTAHPTENITHQATRALQALGYSVHVSDESDYAKATPEAINTMAHFAVADVLIAAKSSFSVAAAYLNPNCVVFLPTNHHPLDRWIIMPEDKHDYQSAMSILDRELPACLRKIGVID